MKCIVFFTEMTNVKDFYDFLVEAELQHYYNSFQTELKVTNVSQLKYVEDEDLSDMGMTKPESRRLKKFFRKECPQGTFGKLKKVRTYLLVVSSQKRLSPWLLVL